MGKKSQFVIEQPSNDEASALVVRFSNGDPVLERCEEDVRFKWYKRKGSNRVTDFKLVASSSSGLDYVGAVAPAEPAERRRYVLALDREGKTAKLLTAHEVKLYPNMVTPEYKEDEPNTTNFRNKMDALTTSFGSNKKKSNVEMRLKHQVANDTLQDAFDTAIDVTMANISEDASFVLRDSKGESTVDYLPPHDMETKDPRRIFPIENIISPLEMDAMSEMTGEGDLLIGMINNTSAGAVTFCEFVEDRINQLPLDQKLRSIKTCHLQYLQYLIQLYHIGKRDLLKYDPLPAGWPPVVKQTLMDRFVQRILSQNGRSVCALPDSLRTKLLSYILILALHVDNFQLLTRKLQSALTISDKKLVAHLRAMGCNVKDATKCESRKATLSAPLKIPTLTDRKRSKTS